MTAPARVKSSMKLVLGRLRAVPAALGQKIRRLTAWRLAGAGEGMAPRHEADAAALLEAELDAEAEADYLAGRILNRRDVREWLAVLADGEKTPPPGVA